MAAKSEADLDTAARELGISRDILDLFPDRLVEGEMELVPEGWEVKPLDNIAHYQNGLALQKFRPKDENNFLPVLKIAQLKKGYADGEEKADPNIKPECIVDNGDVVFSWSGSLLVDVWCGGKVALNQHLFKVTSSEYPKWFYYYWTKQHLENFQRIAKDKAVTMGHIKRSHLSEAMCTIPDDKLFASAEKIIQPLMEKQILNRLEINNLQKTRDSLLPKLLSGELNVSELEIK
jgi:type I restriction enzyme S subunit